MNQQQILLKLWSTGEIGFLIPRNGDERVHIIQTADNDTFRHFTWPAGAQKIKSLEETMEFISSNYKHYMGI